MVLGMRELESFGGHRARRSYRAQGRRLTVSAGPGFYDWDRDFPLHLRDSGPQTTVLQFTFQFDADEVKAFVEAIGSKINGELRVSLTFDGSNQIEFKVIKQKSGHTLTAKLEPIARFIGSRVSVAYVPSIRTAQEASDVVSRLVADELQTLEADPVYQKALDTINTLRAPRLQEIGTSVKDTLGHFLPDVTSVTISLPDERRRLATSRAIEILVDDGHPTPLEMKGDGVQSLAAVALLRRSASEHRSSVRMFLR